MEVSAVQLKFARAFSDEAEPSFDPDWFTAQRHRGLVELQPPMALALCGIPAREADPRFAGQSLANPFVAGPGHDRRCGASRSIALAIRYRAKTIGPNFSSDLTSWPPRWNWPL